MTHQEGSKTQVLQAPSESKFYNLNILTEKGSGSVHFADVLLTEMIKLKSISDLLPKIKSFGFPWKLDAA